MPACFANKLSLQTENQPEIDVLILYTERAMLDANGEHGADRSGSQIESEIATSYQEANNALADSGVGFTIRIVHMEQVQTVKPIILSAW